MSCREADWALVAHWNQYSEHHVTGREQLLYAMFVLADATGS